MVGLQQQNPQSYHACAHSARIPNSWQPGHHLEAERDSD